MADAMNMSDYISYFLALIFIILLIVSIAMFARRLGFGHGQLKISLQKGRFLKPQDKRLLINEVMALDQKRRIVIIQKDQQEYCLLLGTNNDILLSTGDMTMMNNTQTKNTHANFSDVMKNS